MNNKIIDLLHKAKDEDLMMSRFDCHIKGLHSIVIENNKGQLTRCFLAENHHELHRNINIETMLLSLGAHTHRYDIEIQGVTGFALNIKMAEGFGFHCTKYRFTERDKVSVGCSENLFVSSMQPIERGSSLFMDADEIHTVYIPAGQSASWLVYEGHQKKEFTTLYTRLPLHCEKYTEPSSPEQVKDFVINFFAHQPQ